MSIGAVKKSKADQAKHADNVDLKQFYSVEFSLDSIRFLYQFKLWRSPSAPMFVLVKHDSNMLDKIKSGDVVRMKYYSTNRKCPTCHFDTEILDIHWNEHGRFKGHYAVNLGLIDNNRRATLSVL